MKTRRNYARGANFERTVAADLAGRGYVVVRAAGSHGTADIVALKDGYRPLLIQCKTNGVIGPDERRKLAADSRRAGAVPVKAWRPKRGTIAYSVYTSFASTGFQWTEVMP